MFLTANPNMRALAQSSGLRKAATLTLVNSAGQDSATFCGKEGPWMLITRRNSASERGFERRLNTGKTYFEYLRPRCLGVLSPWLLTLLRRKPHENRFPLRLQFCKGQHSYSALTNAGGTGGHLVSFLLRAEINTGPWLPTFLPKQLWVVRENNKNRAGSTQYKTMIQ